MFDIWLWLHQSMGFWWETITTTTELVSKWIVNCLWAELLLHTYLNSNIFPLQHNSLWYCRRDQHPLRIIKRYGHYELWKNYGLKFTIFYLTNLLPILYLLCSFDSLNYTLQYYGMKLHFVKLLSLRKLIFLYLY